MWSTGSLAVFAAFAVAGGAVAAEPVKHLDACSLISPADVAAVTGGTAGTGERNDAGDTDQGGYSSTCVWKLEGLPKLPEKQDAPFGGASFAMLNTIVWPAGTALAKKYVNDFWDAAKQDLIPSNPIAIKGIGEDALFWGDGVAVAKGDISFGVSVHVGTDKKAEQAMEEALAKKIVPKL